MDGARVAIVTGSAQGIGRAIALRLASDGFCVALNDLEVNRATLEKLAAEITESFGRKTAIHTGDVSVEADVQALVDTAVNDLGGVDVMVANAGICPAIPFLDMTVNDFDRLMAINCRSVFLCYQIAARVMLKQGRGGRLIAASSSFAKRGVAVFSGYSASKFGVRGLTQAVSNELGPHGITVNSYAPSVVRTPLAVDAASDATNGNPEARLQIMANLTDVKRLAEPDDVAALVSYIAGPESSFMTGQSLSINGGTFYD